MRKVVLLSFLMLLGFTLVVLSGPIASRLDWILYREEILFSRASEKLEQGNLGIHENTLKDLILRENVSQKLRSLALFNLGVASLAKASQSDPAAARDATFYFQEALRNDPLLFPAKYNLELLLKNAGGRDKDAKTGSSREGAQAEEEREMKRSVVVKPPLLGTNP